MEDNDLPCFHFPGWAGIGLEDIEVETACGGLAGTVPAIPKQTIQPLVSLELGTEHLFPRDRE